jgi:hypothetical protein
MAINAGRIVGLVKMYARLPEDTMEETGDELIYDLINIKMRELSGKTGLYEQTITKNSVASTSEYELPESVVNIKEVTYDGYRIQKMTSMGVNELADKV